MNKKSTKPIHNRRFCIGCHRQKMVFESQSKADNFIKFNSENIAAFSSKVPTRSYYCSFCTAWHVTSVESSEEGAERDKRDEEIWKRIDFINHAKPNVKRRRNKTKSLLEVELTELYCKISSMIAAAMQKLNSLKLEGFNEVLKDLSEQIEDYRVKVCAFYSCEFLPDEKHRLRLNTFNEKLELANIVYSNVRKWLSEANKSKDFIFCCDETYEAKGNIGNNAVTCVNFGDDRLFCTRQKVCETLRPIASNMKSAHRLAGISDEIKIAADNNDFEKVGELVEELKYIQFTGGGIGEYRRKVKNLIKQYGGTYQDPNMAINEDNGISAEEQYRVNIMKMIDLVTEADRIARLGMDYECMRLLKQAERLMPETPDHNTTLIANHIEKIKEYLKS